jgi:Tfp pilus assembly protein PilF
MILAGSPPADVFQKVYGKKMPEVLRDLRAYRNRQSITGMTFDVTLAKSAEDPGIRPVTPLESGMVLAGILADIGKPGEAREAYVKLAVENPASPEVPEALGYLAWRQGQLEEARKQFGKAVELGSKNARMHYQYCALASQAGEPRAKQIALLRKTLELDPEYRDARLHLGYLLLAERDYAGAMAALTPIKKVEPGQAFEFFHAMAYAAYRLGAKETARENAKRAADYAKEPGEQALVDQLLAALEEKQEERSQVVAVPPPEKEEDQPRPVLRERVTREAPQLRSRPSLAAVEGTLDQIDCLGTTARLRMTAAGRSVRLLIDKPGSIEVRGSKTGSLTMTCGPQKTRLTMRVEYVPKENSQLGTIGLVRVVELK